MEYIIYWVIGFALGFLISRTISIIKDKRNGIEK